MDKITREALVELINPSNGETITIKEEDLPKLINDIVFLVGYDPLQKYFEKYEIADNIFVCLSYKNTKKPHFFVHIVKRE